MEVSKHRLLIFIGTLGAGGAEHTAVELANHFVDEYDEVGLVTCFDKPDFYQCKPDVRRSCIEREIHSRSPLKMAWWLRRYCRVFKPTVVLSFMMPFNILATWALRGTGVPVVGCERSDPKLEGTSKRRKLRDCTYRFIDRIQVQTVSARDYFGDKLKGKIHVIPNANRITPEQRHRAMTRQRENRIVYVGRLEDFKGVDVLIDAFCKVMGNHKDYRLDIYGDGRDRECLQQKVKSLGMAESVIFHGRVQDVPSNIGSARLLVLPSYIEGMPNVLIEAVGLGLPVVATDVCGVRDIVEDGKNGIVVPIHDEKALAQAMLKIIEDERLAAEMSEYTGKILPRFDQENIMALWQKLLEEAERCQR